MHWIVVWCVIVGSSSCKPSEEAPPLRDPGAGTKRKPKPTEVPTPQPTKPIKPTIPQPASDPAVAEVAGLAVAVLVDRSGSMSESIDGSVERKEHIARRAISKAFDATKVYAAKRPDYPVKVGLIAFAGEAEIVAPIEIYSEGKLLDALDRIPFAYGETAIGDAIGLARVALMGAGMTRKHIIVITDGDNSVGVEPKQAVADVMNDGIMVHVVAFDTDASKFAYVADNNGTILSAHSDKGLVKALQQIYQKKILAEAFEE